MKIRTDKAILRFLGIGIGLIFVGVIMYLSISPRLIGIYFFFCGFIMIVIGLYGSTRPIDSLIPDERITKNMDKAGHHDFWMVLLVVTALGMIELYFPLSKTYRDGSALIMFVGIYSFLILRWYYNRRVDFK